VRKGYEKGGDTGIRADVVLPFLVVYASLLELLDS
jgi:hypothetical protein